MAQLRHRVAGWLITEIAGKVGGPDFYERFAALLESGEHSCLWRGPGGLRACGKVSGHPGDHAPHAYWEGAW